MRTQTMLDTEDLNTNSPIQTSWSVVEAITASMKGAAEMQNWFDVVEQATARHNLLLTHFELFPVGPENADFYRQRLGNMLNGEQNLQSLVRNARKSLMSEGLVMNQGHRAVGAYLESSQL